MAFPKSILVPIDFLPKSESAIRYACEIAQYTGAEIHFLHVVQEPYQFATRADEILPVIKNERAEKIEQLINDLHSIDDFRSIKMTGLIEKGNIQMTIQRVAEEYKHNMVVIALGGEPDLKKVMYGSITNNILIESNVPVLAISKKIDYRTPNHLVFATDLRDGDIKPIKRMKRFAIDIGVDLKILHIVPDKNQVDHEAINKFNKKIQGSLKAEDIAVELHEATTFDEGITRFVKNHKYTILVMTRYKRKFFEWLFSNSRVRNIAQIASVPLLMIPHKEK
ncbi:MAG: universal stress protein [Balneolaceae bacterium]